MKKKPIKKINMVGNSFCAPTHKDRDQQARKFLEKGKSYKVPDEVNEDDARALIFAQKAVDVTASLANEPTEKEKEDKKK